MTDKLTIRDQFAMAALTGLCADPAHSVDNLPKTSYNLAEKMLAEKERRDVQALLAEREHQKKLKAIEEKVLQESSGLIKAFDKLDVSFKNLERRQKTEQPSPEETTVNNWLAPGVAVMSSSFVYDVKVALNTDGETGVVIGVKDLIKKMYSGIDGWYLDCLCLYSEKNIILLTDELVPKNGTAQISKIPLRVLRFRRTI